MQRFFLKNHEINNNINELNFRIRALLADLAVPVKGLVPRDGGASIPRQIQNHAVLAVKRIDSIESTFYFDGFTPQGMTGWPCPSC
jgi:hypothetical protein